MKPWHHVPIPMFQDDDSQRSQNKANMYNWWKRSSKGGNKGAHEWNIVSLSLSHSRAVWSVVMCISLLPRHRSKDEVRIFSYNLTKINNPWTETSTSPPFPGFQAKVPVLRISGSLFLIIPPTPIKKCHNSAQLFSEVISTAARAPNYNRSIHEIGLAVQCHTVIRTNIRGECVCEKP